MWCVVGLGNPGPRYRWSRHNVGFQFIDRLSLVSGIKIDRRSPQVAWGKGIWCEEPVLLARPLAFMNLSGVGVRVLRRQHGCDPDSLIVVHDDLDLGVGRLKFKQRGGDGGHKGIRSIMETLGQDRFLRLRIGIGRPPRGVDATEFVLEPFREEEREVLEEALERALGGIETLIVDGLPAAMRQCHVSLEPRDRKNEDRME